MIELTDKNIEDIDKEKSLVLFGKNGIPIIGKYVGSNIFKTMTQYVLNDDGTYSSLYTRMYKNAFVGYIEIE